MISIPETRHGSILMFKKMMKMRTGRHLGWGFCLVCKNVYLCGHERGHESGNPKDCVAGDCGQHHGAAAWTGGYRYRRAPGRQDIHWRRGCGRDDV